MYNHEFKVSIISQNYSLESWHVGLIDLESRIGKDSSLDLCIHIFIHSFLNTQQGKKHVEFVKKAKKVETSGLVRPSASLSHPDPEVEHVAIARVLE